MATELAKAYVQIIPSAQGIQKGVESSLTGEMSSIGDKAGSSFGKNFLKVGAGVIGAGVAAVGAAAGAVWSAASATAQAGDEIDKTSQKIGVSAEQYQAMAFAAEHCGFEVTTFQTAAKNLSNTDFEGNMADALNTIMKLEDASERTAMAQELFGDKAAQSMAALLNGEDDLEDYKDQLEAIGGLMSDETVASSAAFEDSLTNLQTAFSGLKNGLMGDFLPTITQVMDGITLLLNGDDSGMAMIKEGINSFLGQLNEMLPQFLEFGVQLISDFCDVIIENLPQLIEMGIELIVKLIVGIMEAIPKIIERMPEIIMAVVTGLKNGLPAILDAGKTMVEGLWEGIKKATEWLKEKIKEWVGNVVDFLKGLFGINSPSKLMRDAIGQWLPKGIAVGIESNIDSVEGAMKDIEDIASNSIDISGVSGRLHMDNSSSKIDELISKLDQGAMNVNVTLEGDTRKFFKAMQTESTDYNKRTGRPAFA